MQALLVNYIMQDLHKIGIKPDGFVRRLEQYIKTVPVSPIKSEMPVSLNQLIPPMLLQ